MKHPHSQSIVKVYDYEGTPHYSETKVYQNYRALIERSFNFKSFRSIGDLKRKLKERYNERLTYLAVQDLQSDGRLEAHRGVSVGRWRRIEKVKVEPEKFEYVAYSITPSDKTWPTPTGQLLI